MIYIGIDPGVKNGFAVWDGRVKRFIAVESYPFWDLIDKIDTWMDAAKIQQVGFAVILEKPPLNYTVDAKTKKRINARERASRAKGVGSVNRTYQLIKEYLERENIKHETPIAGKHKTKVNAQSFRNLTKYMGNTNEHGRDAGMLVWGRGIQSKRDFIQSL